MRIVGGENKGRPLHSLEGRHTRPTADRVREALFSSLFSRLSGFEGLQVLDGFAGSGALGLEALSRGAARAVFFENDRAAAAVVKANVEACGIPSASWSLRRADVLHASFAGEESPFDLVFLDPPYAFDPVEVLGLVRRLGDQGALAPGALAVYEHDGKRCDEVREAAAGAGLNLVHQRKYGKCVVSLLEESR